MDGIDPHGKSKTASAGATGGGNTPATLITQLEEIQKSITSFQLVNGITVIVMQRPNVPVVSFVTQVDVGSSNEIKGLTGLAHVFEHMAFKGTRDIGVTDHAAEAQVLAEMDQVFDRVAAERRRGNDDASPIITELKKQLVELQRKATVFVVNNEFSDIVDRHGGKDTNASTSADATVYYLNLPSNKVELWAWLESERLRHPVLREFYQEKEVIKEERRLRYENSPIGRLIEEVQCAAFKAHPYGEPVIGHMADIENTSRRDAEAFHARFYVGSNITIAIVGDVKAAEIRPLMERYFGPIPTGEPAGRVPTIEPLQVSEKRIILYDTSQPVVVLAYHRPDIRHPDDPVFEVLQDILAGGSSSRLYKKLVKETRSALYVGVYADFPGSKYPSLFVCFAMPNAGHNAVELEQGITAELERIKDEAVQPGELAAVLARAQVKLYNNLLSNSGMAEELAFNHVVTGDWRHLFKRLERLQEIAPADVQRVAQDCFNRANLTSGMLIQPSLTNKSKTRARKGR